MRRGHGMGAGLLICAALFFAALGAPPHGSPDMLSCCAIRASLDKFGDLIYGQTYPGRISFLRRLYLLQYTSDLGRDKFILSP